MAIKKNNPSEQSSMSEFLNEQDWRREKNKLKKLSNLLFYDIQRLESFYCLEMKTEINFFDEVRRFEINLIKTALVQAGGSQRRCAELLGISTSNLNNKIKNYGITLKSLKANSN